MILISHPYEDDVPAIISARAEAGAFLTKKIQQYLPEFPVLNFPLNWFPMQGTEVSAEKTAESFLLFAGRADAAIFIDFPGRELCERTRKEKEAIRRLEIPVVLFPYYRHRFAQQCKQDCLLADQRRVLNLLLANLEHS